MKEKQKIVKKCKVHGILFQDEVQKASVFIKKNGEKSITYRCKKCKDASLRRKNTVKNVNSNTVNLILSEKNNASYCLFMSETNKLKIRRENEQYI